MPGNEKGFTLIELTVVVLLIGIIAALTFPRFRQAVTTDTLKSSTRKLVGIIRNLRTEAVKRHDAYFLRFDLDTNLFWIERQCMTETEQMAAKDKAVTLPGGVRILDVWLKGKGKETTGITTIRFNEKGYVQQSAIHLGFEDGRKFTLVLSTFLAKVEILDSYVEFEET
jgi:prepilin-type N-terminal cleavage/methylation domain-containing protein